MKKTSKKMRLAAPIQLNNIRSLTAFQRNARQAIRDMKRTGQPQVLTVKGKAELVVQDAQSYQRLLDALDRAASVRAIQEGIAAFDRGEGYPIEQAIDRIRRKHGIPSRNTSGRGT